MRLVRVVLGAALVAGTVPFATSSQAMCSPDVAVVCGTIVRTCRTARDKIGVPLNCPVF